MTTLTGAIERRMRARGSGPALSWRGEELSYVDLDRRSATLAAGLRAAGVRLGDRIAVGLPNSAELVASAVAVLRAGAVLVPLNPAYSGDEASYIVSDSAPALIITHDRQAEAVGEVCTARVVTNLAQLEGNDHATVEKGGEDAALIVYTSGTTGRPKGAVLSERGLLSNLSTVAQAWQWTERDRLLLTLPCFHLHGLGLGILGSLLVGSSIVLRDRFRAEEVFRDIRAHRCTMFFGVPTMYNRLVGLPEEGSRAADLGSMRLWVSGSAPLTAATFERFRERFHYEILERFGMSEGGFVLGTSFDEVRRPGVVGKPFRGIDVAIIDADEADQGRLRGLPDGETGELVFRGPNLFSGYWRRSEDTKAAFVDGFFRSGDLAVREANGMIRIVGRRSVDVIKSGGFKIGAVEIESCLQSHPAVAEVAVIGIPDPDLGERVVAVVTAVSEAKVGEDEILAHARQHLAPQKVPRQVVFRAEIPRTGPGKLDKKKLIRELGRRSPEAPTPTP
jgi:acyl-CoA synthetase (AMP-forming)/AMP-acid ligase II